MTNCLVVVLHNRDCIPLSFNDIRKLYARIPITEEDHAKLGVYAVQLAHNPHYRVPASNTEYRSLILKMLKRLQFFRN